MVKKIILSAVAVVFVSVVILTVWQWDNICAFIDGVRYDEQQLEQKAVQSQEEVDRRMEEASVSVVPLTPEQDKALQNGDITEEDAIAIMTGKISFEDAVKENNVSNNEKKPEQIPSNSDNNAQQGDINQDGLSSENTDNAQDVDYDSLISEKVANLYVIKSNFYGQFNAEWARHKAMFLQLPKNEQTRTRIAQIVKECIPRGAAMEKECDAQVNEVLSELKALLKQAGRDTSLADSIKSAYDSEKKAMKSKLINKYF